MKKGDKECTTAGLSFAGKYQPGRQLRSPPLWLRGTFLRGRRQTGGAGSKPVLSGSGTLAWQERSNGGARFRARPRWQPGTGLLFHGESGIRRVQ